MDRDINGLLPWVDEPNTEINPFLSSTTLDEHEPIRIKPTCEPALAGPNLREDMSKTLATRLLTR